MHAGAERPARLPFHPLQEIVGRVEFRGKQQRGPFTRRRPGRILAFLRRDRCGTHDEERGNNKNAFHRSRSLLV